MTDVLEVLWHGFKDSFLMAWEVWWALVLGSPSAQWCRRGCHASASSTRWRRGRAPGRAGDRAGRSLLLVLLRRGGDRQEPLREGRSRRGGAGVPVRLHQPRVGAGTRAVGADRLAVHARGVRGRHRDDRADDALVRLFVSAPGRAARPRARGARRHLGHDHSHRRGHGTAMARRSERALRERARSIEAWSDVANSFRGDWAMLWKEIAAGFVLAGSSASWATASSTGSSWSTRPAR